jgi:hypothetical protein
MQRTKAIQPGHQDNRDAPEAAGKIKREGLMLD